jgi:hypothetical protein
MKAAFLCLLVFFASRQAHAQETPEERRTAAEALFVEGRRLVAEGKPDEACQKFAESQRLDPGVGTLLNLARCYARTGKTASAWAAYREAAGHARATGQAEREVAARTEAERLEPTLSRLEVTLTEAASRQRLSIVLDGQPWSSALIGVGTPVDPGEHTLVARGAGLRPWTTHFETEPAGKTRVEIRALLADPRRAATTPAPEPWRGTHTAAVAVAAVGVAATVAGAVWGLDARSTYDRSDPYCNAGNECQPAGLALREDAFDRARLATVAFSAGGVALVSAAVLWFTRRSPDHLPWANTTARGSRTPFTLGVQF